MEHRRTLIACAVGLLLLGAGAWWLMRGGRGVRVDETLASQRRVLAGEVVGREAKAAIDKMFRDVDKMSRDELKTLRGGLMGEWARVNQAAVDEYHAADAGERETLLDRHIGRIVTAGELFNASNPYASGLARPPRPPRKPTKPPTEEQERLEAYRAAVVARAGKQRIAVPEWLLGIARR